MTSVAPAGYEDHVLVAHTRIFWRRFSALMVDTLLFSGIMIILSNVFGVAHILSGNGMTTINGNWVTSTQQLPLFWQVLALVLYFTAQEALFGRTIGKAWNDLYVIPLNGQRLTFWQVLLRNVLRPVDYFFYIGALVASLSPLRQRIGDHAARTIVVHASALPEAPIPAPVRNRRLWALGAIMVLFAIGCAIFNYVGRPGLVVEGNYNLRQGEFTTPSFGCQPAGFSEGQKQWRDWQTITYTYFIQCAGSTSKVEGIFTLHWEGPLTGWQEQGGEMQLVSP